MKFCGAIAGLGFSLWMIAAFSAAAQRVPEPLPGAPAAGQAQPALREIDDPHSGLRWLLVRDATHPGGPGRLVELHGETALDRAPSPALPVIHMGDRVRVEEHTRVADAIFDSVALGPAVKGAPLRLRLRIGGRIVRAIAVAPGRAALTLEIRP